MLKKLFCLMLLASVVRAESYMYQIVQPVSQQDGDTITTQQISVGVCPGTNCPTLLWPAVTDYTNRRRTLHNTSAFKIWIGSNTTTLQTTGFQLDESSQPAGGYWSTSNTGALYATALSTGTITIIKETNSAP